MYSLYNNRTGCYISYEVRPKSNPMSQLEPTPVPTPSPTPVPTPSPTPVPTPVPTPSPTPVPTPSPTPVPTPVPTPSPTPVPTPSPTPSPTPVPTPPPVSGIITFNDNSTIDKNSIQFGVLHDKLISDGTLYPLECVPTNTYTIPDNIISSPDNAGTIYAFLFYVINTNNNYNYNCGGGTMIYDGQPGIILRVEVRLTAPNKGDILFKPTHSIMTLYNINYQFEYIANGVSQIFTNELYISDETLTGSFQINITNY